MKKPYIPEGVDQQGRGTDNLNCAAGIIEWVIVALAMWTIVLMSLLFLGVI